MKSKEPNMFRDRDGLARDCWPQSVESNFDPMQSVGQQLGRPLQYQSVDRSVTEGSRSVSVWLTEREWKVIQELRKNYD